MSEGAEGRVRGACLSRWAATLNQRHGPEAATLIRLSLALAPSSLLDDPQPKSWLPVTTQLALNQAICERFGVPYVQESVWKRLRKTVKVMTGRETQLPAVIHHRPTTSSTPTPTPA